jgi:hypothetical protein
VRGEKLRAVLEDVDDLGLLVLRNSPRSFFIRNADSSPLGFYDLHEDLAFRHGWVELPGSAGRHDCLDWPTFYDLIRERAKKPKR